MAHPGGRPLKYETDEELQNAIDSYFLKIDQWNDEHDGAQWEPYTVSGLALHLDVDTETLRNYEKREQFFGTVKRAKQRIEQQLEKMLLTKQQVTGPIFNLKNNYGWKDRTDITSNDKELPTPILNGLSRNHSNEEDSSTD